MSARAEQLRTLLNEIDGGLQRMRASLAEHMQAANDDTALAQVAQRVPAALLRFHDLVGAKLRRIGDTREPAAVPGVPEPQWPAPALAPQAQAEAAPAAEKLQRWSAERNALLAAEYHTEITSAELLAKLRALPGAPLDWCHVVWIAKMRGLRRSKTAKSVALCAAASARIVWTPERVERLTRDYQAGVPEAELRAALAAMPGRKICRHAIANKVQKLGLRRPIGSNTMWTQARDAVILAEWPKGTCKHEVWRMVSELPGPAIKNTHACAQRAALLKVRRPAGHGAANAMAPVAKPVAPAPVPAAPRPKPAVQRSAPPVHAAPCVPASAPPRSVYQRASVSAHFSPSQRQRADEDRLVAEFLAKRGATRCPAAAVEACSVTISAEDQAALRAHHQARADQRAAEAQERADRHARNRQRKLAGLPPIVAAHPQSPAVPAQ